MVVQHVQVHQVLTAKLALQLEPLNIQAFQGGHFLRELLVNVFFVALQIGAVFEVHNA